MIWLLLSLFLQAYVPQGATSLDFPATTYYNESSGRTLCYHDKCVTTAPAPVFVSQLPNYISLPYFEHAEYWGLSNLSDVAVNPKLLEDNCRLVHCRKGMKFNAGDDLVPCDNGYACIPEGAYTLNVCATLENGRIWCDNAK